MSENISQLNKKLEEKDQLLRKKHDVRHMNMFVVFVFFGRFPAAD